MSNVHRQARDFAVWCRVRGAYGAVPPGNLPWLAPFVLDTLKPNEPLVAWLGVEHAPGAHLLLCYKEESGLTPFVVIRHLQVNPTNPNWGLHNIETVQVVGLCLVEEVLWTMLEDYYLQAAVESAQEPC